MKEKLNQKLFIRLTTSTMEWLELLASELDTTAGALARMIINEECRKFSQEGTESLTFSISKRRIDILRQKQDTT